MSKDTAYPTEQLGDHIALQNGFAFKSEQFGPQGDLPIIRIRDVKRGYSETYYSGEYEERYLVNDGDLLIGMDGEFNREKWRGGLALLNQRVCKISVISKKLTDNYLYHFLPHALDEIENKTPFATVKHLSSKEIEKINVPLPPLDEQRRIAAILDKADALRRKRKEALEANIELAESLFMSLHQSSKKGWSEFRLDGLAMSGSGTFGNGPFGSDLLTSELKDSGVPVIYIRDIVTGSYKRISKSHVTSEKAKALSAAGVKSGDLLISKVGDPPGVAAVYPFDQPDGIVTQDVIRFRPNLKKILPEYFAYYLNSSIGRHAIAGITVAATRARFSLTDLKKLTVFLPPLAVQLDFQQAIRSVDSSYLGQTKSQQNLDSLFSSLQYRAFSGQL